MLKCVAHGTNLYNSRKDEYDHKVTVMTCGTEALGLMDEEVRLCEVVLLNKNKTIR